VGPPAGNEPVGPVDVSWCLNRTDCGDGTSTFGHHEPGT